MSRLMEALYDVYLPVRDALAIQAVLDGDRARACALLAGGADVSSPLVEAREPAPVVEAVKVKPKPKPKGITFGKRAKGGGNVGMKRTCTVCGKEKGVTGFLSRSHICRACADKAGTRAATMAEAES
jgi:hypothetical protein